MKVCAYVIGKTDEAWIREGLEIYRKKLQPYLSFEYLEIIPLIGSRKAQTPEAHQLAERDALNKLIRPQDMLILLDERGKEFSSRAFSEFVEKKFHQTSGNIIFIAGGPFGFHADLYARANESLSLSRMTFTHQMVRVIFLEQLYRAMTILRNEPYHHD